MGKTLIIVESNSKMKIFNEILGSEYTVFSTNGFLCDIQRIIEKIVKDDSELTKFNPLITIKSGKGSLVNKLKDYADKAEKILIATDPDRIGEFNAWSISQILHLDEACEFRLRLFELSRSTVLSAIEAPDLINMSVVNAQKAKWILLNKFFFGPAIYLKGYLKYGDANLLFLSLDQAIATSIIYENSKLVLENKKDTIWRLKVCLHNKGSKTNLEATYIGEDQGDRFHQNQKIMDTGYRYPLSNISAEEFKNIVRDKDFYVKSLKNKYINQYPGSPYDTYTLLQESLRYLKYDSKKTIQVAKQLYDGIDIPELGLTSLISYYRTQYTNVPETKIQAAFTYNKNHFESNYCLNDPQKFDDVSIPIISNAIYPVNLDLEPEKIKQYLTNPQYKLYSLIWKKFIASQMTAAQLEFSEITIECDSHLFCAYKENVIFPGYKSVFDYENNSKTNRAASTKNIDIQKIEVRKNEVLFLSQVLSEKLNTIIENRVTETNVIKFFENVLPNCQLLHADTISSCIKIGLIKRSKEFLIPTDLGIKISEFIKSNFGSILDLKILRQIDNDLESIELGKLDWQDIIFNFFDLNKETKKYWEAHRPVDSRGPFSPIATGLKCPSCNDGELIDMKGLLGQKLYCSDFPTCKFSLELQNKIFIDSHCPICHSGLLIRNSKKFNGAPFYTCDRKGEDPKCTFASWHLPIDDLSCPKCGSYMVQKKYRGRTFTKCGNKDCETNQKTEKVDVGEHSDSY